MPDEAQDTELVQELAEDATTAVTNSDAAEAGESANAVADEVLADERPHDPDPLPYDAEDAAADASADPIEARPTEAVLDEDPGDDAEAEDAEAVPATLGRVVIVSAGATDLAAVVSRVHNGRLVDVHALIDNPAKPVAIMRSVAYNPDGAPGTWRWPTRV